MNTTQVAKMVVWLIILQVTRREVSAQSTTFTYQGRLTANGVAQAGSYDLTFTLYDAVASGTKLGGPLTNTAATDANGLFTVTLDFGSAVFNGGARWLEIGARPSGNGAFTTLAPRQPLTANPYAFYATTPAGPAGAPGSVWREGLGAPGNSLGIDGDYYLNGTTGDVYQRASGTYSVVSNIKGPDGNTGSPGVQGQAGTPGSVWREGSGAPANTLGIDGDYYLNGATGDVYQRTSGTYNVVSNIKGPQGVAGNTGGPGQAGTPGSVWREGSGAPANTLGIDGDYYLNGATGDIYQRTLGSYNVVSNIKGPQGVPGNNGSPGQAGTPGSVWREGSGAPANTLGIDGDYYLNGTTGDIYQRTSGTYNVVSNIKGPQGVPGNTGNPGQPGAPGSVWREGSGAPSNTTGIDGDYYLDGSTGNVYVRSSGTYAVVANIKGTQGQPGLVALPFSGGVTTNIAAFTVDNSGSGAAIVAGAVSGDGVNASTDTGYAVSGQANSSGWGGLFRYGSDGNNSAYLGSSSGAGLFYGAVTVNGSTSNVLFEAKNSGSGGNGVAMRGDAPLFGAYGELGASIETDFLASYGVYGNGGSAGYAGWFDGTVNVAGSLEATAINSGAISGSSLQAGPVSPYGATLSAIGTRTGFYNQPIAYIENQNTGSGSSPALRVVSSGDSQYGALSVSQQGTGLIAQFGNASAFVSKLDSAGNWCGTSFVGCSDRNVKENFRDVNAREVLEKVAALPITRWNFKADTGTEHLGPMSQDFYSAFGVGVDDKHIATVDADGVALAAVQGLNQKVEEQSAALRAKDAEIRTLEQRLKKLETLVEKFSAK